MLDDFSFGSSCRLFFDHCWSKSKSFLFAIRRKMWKLNAPEFGLKLATEKNDSAILGAVSIFEVCSLRYPLEKQCWLYCTVNQHHPELAEIQTVLLV